MPIASLKRHYRYLYSPDNHRKMTPGRHPVPEFMQVIL
jgi:hypothetical protein